MSAAANNAEDNGTYGISGIPLSPDVKYKTKSIPYAPGMPVRLRLSTLASSDDPTIKMQWTLFILALEKFKALPVEQKLSYFQIAGIHGYPQTAWDEASPPPPSDPPINPEEFFYCAHNTVTFPTWHRPYMLLYEKRLWCHMKEVIESFIESGDLAKSDADVWNSAADTWRLPYWDWAQKQTYNDKFSLPEVFTKDTVQIYPPNAILLSPKLGLGGGTTYANPLWGFKNPETGSDNKPLKMGEMPKGKESWNIGDDGTESTRLPWSQCSGVSRWGIFKSEDGSYIGLAGVNNFEAANNTINRFSKTAINPYPDDDEKHHEDHKNWIAPGSLADAVNRMFSKDYNSTWATFASTQFWQSSEKDVSTGYMSLEYIHNNVHNMSGGTDLKSGLGHMSDVPVAAFDPLFWLHHCNVDRLLSMWQVLNWDAWWTVPDYVIQSTSLDPSRAKSWDPLKPFHTKDNGDPKEDYWTSDMARDWTKLNYQYDDLVPNENAVNSDDGTLDEEQYKVDLLAHIQKIYPSTKNYIHAIRSDPRIKNEEFFGVNYTESESWDDYIINVVYDRYALNGRSYAIQFWLGGHPDDPVSTFDSTENFIGQVYAFAGVVLRSAESDGCSNCGAQRDSKVLSRAQVPVTVPITVQALNKDFRHIQTMRENAVEKYLKENLHWKFVQLGGAVRPASDFPETKISILRGIGKPQYHEDGTHLPAAFASYHTLPLLTDKKECGLRVNDPILGLHASHNFRSF